MFPAGVITRTIKVGPASDLSSGIHLGIRVMVTPSRSLVWNGEPVISGLKTYTFQPGTEGEIALPVTNQAGYRDSKGNIIVVPSNGHGFFYKISIFYLNGGSVVSKKPELKAVLPSGSGAVDVDTLVSFDSNGEGVISIPDTWSSQITAAQAAATASAASAAAALDAVEALEGNIDTAVTEWFDEHSGTIVSPAVLNQAMQAHKDEPTPHKAYDVDIPSLSVLFENGLA